MADAGNDDRVSQWGGIFIAPLIVAFSGSLYVAGHIARNRLAGAFGLDGAMFNVSIQDTMVSGYLSVVLIIVVGAISLVSFLIAHLAGTLFEYLCDRRKGFVYLFRRDLFWLPTSALFWAIVALLLLVVSSISAGIIWADRSIRNAIEDVNGNCGKRCFIYEFERRTIIGSPIVASAERVAVLTGAGVIVEDMTDLRSVRQFNPSFVYEIGPRSSKRPEPPVPLPSNATVGTP